jgi:hypothetical protein
LRLTGLWYYPDFEAVGRQTISVFGTLVTTFALPVTAILLLKATPLQFTLLSAAKYAPGLLVSFFAGAWVDRLRRRPILVAADLRRAVLLGSIPAAALLVSVLADFFDVAYLSYLPTLVRREELLEGTSKLQASASIAEVAGFGLGGVLVQALTAPVAILIDAISFVVSAASVAVIRRAESTPAPSEDQPNACRKIGQGTRLLLGNPILRASPGASGTFIFFRNMAGVVLMLFFLHELALPPVILGPFFALCGVSAFAGALLEDQLTRRWGVGRTLLSGLLLSELTESRAGKTR